MNARSSKLLRLAVVNYIVHNKEHFRDMALEKARQRNAHGGLQHLRINPSRLAKKFVRAEGLHR